MQTTYFSYSRTLNGTTVIVTVNNSDNDVDLNLSCDNCGEYIGALTGERVGVNEGNIQVHLPANYGEIWIPKGYLNENLETIKTLEIGKVSEQIKDLEEPVKAEIQEEIQTNKVNINLNKPYEEMSVEELQEVILEKMKKNGPITDYMLGTVSENTHRGSLINWIKSFN